MAMLQSDSVVVVAQLVESRIVIPVVVGSSPIVHPTELNKKAHFLVGFLFGFFVFLVMCWS
jgi:hypothetical protein